MVERPNAMPYSTILAMGPMAWVSKKTVMYNANANENGDESNNKKNHSIIVIHGARIRMGESNNQTNT